MRKKWIIVLFIILYFELPCFCQEAEYQIKAVFLEQFTRFIEWPDSSGESNITTPFVIKVLGKNPFGNILEQTYAKKKINNKTVEIQYISNPAEITDCHILFISSSLKSVLPEILCYTLNKPILTVGDTEGFAQQDVIINFYLSDNKVKFEINQKAAQDSGLTISYILFNIAKIVKPIRGSK